MLWIRSFPFVLLVTLLASCTPTISEYAVYTDSRVNEEAEVDLSKMVILSRGREDLVNELLVPLSNEVEQVLKEDYDVDVVWNTCQRYGRPADTELVQKNVESYDPRLVLMFEQYYQIDGRGAAGDYDFVDVTLFNPFNGVVYWKGTIDVYTKGELGLADAVSDARDELLKRLKNDKILTQ